MSNPDLVVVGRVGRPHGVDGSFFVDGASEADERFDVGATLHVEAGTAKVVVSKRGSGRRRVLKLDREVPRGSTLAVPRSELPEPDDDTFYVFQLVGLDVVEEGERALGAVVEVHNGPANDALELESGLLLPLVDACVLDVDLEARRIVVARGFADAE